MRFCILKQNMEKIQKRVDKMATQCDRRSRKCDFGAIAKHSYATDKLSTAETEQIKGNNVSDKMSSTFTQDTAQSIGQSQRTIQRKTEVGNAFTDDVVEKLKETKVANGQNVR